MAKLKFDPILKSDLTDFLKTSSDFAFEIHVLNELTRLGFECEHGGSYTDRVTRKPREFDIRATKRYGKCFVRLAVECKNLRPNYPLLISCLPRRPEESFNDLSISVNPAEVPLEKRQPYSVPAFAKVSKCLRLTKGQSLYRPKEPVGKACDQVGRSTAGEFVSGDADIYAKWSQALSSADDLVDLACHDGRDRTGNIAASLVLPILAVPDGQLWIVTYNSDGNLISGPENTDRCPYFVNLTYHNSGDGHSESITLSHIEFTTTTGLSSLVDALFGDEQKLANTFPNQQIERCITVNT
jgi:hypothetical protein